MKKLVIVGGGELSRVVIEAARAQNTWEITGFVDPDPCYETVKRTGVPRLGDDTVLGNLTDEKIILGVGTISVSSVRRDIVKRINDSERWATIVHPFTSISPTANISPGVIILPGAVVCSGAVVAEHAIINVGVTIDHDVFIGEFVHLAPQAAIGGGSRVEDDAYIGMGAIIKDHLTVSAGTLVGMGAVVSKHFPSGSILVGVPARPK